MTAFLQLGLAVAISMAVIPLVRRLAPRLGLVDMPDPRKVHTVPVPRVGGWGITLGTLLPLVLVFRPDPLVQSYLIGCLVLFVFGTWDDARSLGHWTKFAGQLVAAGVVVFYGDLWVSRMPLLDAAVPPVFGRPFTLFALIGVINAINHSDGLDGLAGGETILSLISLAILGYMAHNVLILSIALATIGGIFGFLRYNSHPAYVFMGDSGSQVLGFTLGFLVVYVTQEASVVVSAALPLLVLGLPVADIISVLYQRIRGGMNWFKATRNHVHHRLLQLGFDHYETVVIIYLVQAAFVVAAVLTRFESDTAVLLLYLGATTALFSVLYAAERCGWRRARPRGDEPGLTRVIGVLKADRTLLRGSLLLITALTPAVMLASAICVTHIPGDLAKSAAALAVVPAIQLLWPRAQRPALLRLVIYGTAIFPAYLLVNSPKTIPHEIQAVAAAVVIVLAIAVVAFVRFSADQRFGTTPTDYLIVCGVIALTVFSSIEVNSRNVVEAVLFATVLMYACEILVGDSPGSGGRRLLQYSTLGTLLIVAVRGLP